MRSQMIEHRGIFQRIDGNMAIDAVINRDLPLSQGIVLLFALIFTGVNLIVDLLYAVLNPRLRHA